VALLSSIVTERPWWRDPRRLDPWTENARTKTLSQTRVWVMRVTWAAMIVFFVAWTLYFGPGFFLIPYGLLIAYTLLSRPRHQRDQVLGRRRCS
jgi:hypothetical protein